MILFYRTSKRCFALTAAAIFLIALAFNIMTPMLADDFNYCFSFADGSPIKSVDQISSSMIAHGELVNGRYFSHALVQLFLMLPAFVFDLVNAAVLVATVYLTYRIANAGKRTDTLFFLGIFGAYWLFQWDLGQTTFWLDGAVNYLFALFFSLLFLYPYVQSVLHRRKMHPLLILPHMLLSVWIGGYLEMTAVGFVGCACLLLGADLFCFKNLHALRLLPSIPCALVGFAIMALSPAQAVNKFSDFSPATLLSTLGISLFVLASVFPLIILFVCLFKEKYRDETHRRRILTAIAVALGALASNFVLVFAKYYSLRSSCCFVFLSILATALLWGGEELPIPSRRMQKWLKIFSLALILAVVIGIADVGFTLYQVNQNEALIAEAVAQGEGSITLNCPIPWTKYNALSGLRYLSTDAQDPWPNIYLAKYYGIGEIHGSMAESPWIEWLLSY